MAGLGEGAEGTPQVVGVRLRAHGRLVWARFAPAAPAAVQAGDWVLVETAAGRDAGRVVAPAVTLPPAVAAELLPSLLRLLTQQEVARLREVEAAAPAVLAVAQERAADLGLALRPVWARYSYDGSRLTFFYAGAGDEAARLAADLAVHLGLPVELHSAGAPGTAAAIGGAGRVTAPVCCTRDLPAPDAAGRQEVNRALSDTPDAWARLGGSLSWTSEGVPLRSDLPRLNTRVLTPQGAGRVIRVDVGSRLATVALDATGATLALPLADLQPAPGEA